ncbi:hypothetical protein M405DRAFT_856488 [Rhizopogon salebrosus TDB-379]|nr:hypothetical protein M405DRAFT_856488 [Rhizopogon salebrosus TDB-379]
MTPLLNPVDQETSAWPKRVPAPSKRLTDTSNSATPELSAHLEAIALKRAEDAKRLAKDARPVPQGDKRSRNADSSGTSEDDTDHSTVPKPPKKKKSHSSRSVIISNHGLISLKRASIFIGSVDDYKVL